MGSSDGETTDFVFEGKTLIDQYEEKYRFALASIDNDVKELIQNGKEMRGIFLYMNSISTIIEIHKDLDTLYSYIYKNKELLHKYNSKRLKQLSHNNHYCVPTASLQKNSYDKSIASKTIESPKFMRTHPFLENSLLSEIEYLLATLHGMIEPDFFPQEYFEVDSTDEGRPNRYIFSSVQRAVWRRDYGKCVQCGSQEKIEYDHIIPVSKGGSNTERNIQLLCEKCNRKKHASIP